MTEFLNYINGQWCKSESGRVFESRNPANTEDVIGTFQASNEVDARLALDAANRAFPAWKKMTVGQRANILNKAAAYLENHVDSFAEELTREEGKLLSNSKAEILRSAQTMRFYAVEATTFTGETFPSEDPDMLVYSYREPMGVVSVITPWNFPISIPARKIAPALAMGNTVVFKPSSDTPLIALRIAEALDHAGVPPGVFNYITGSARDIGAEITQNPVVRAITFTGSTNAGQVIHRGAGITTRTQMELGGKNPLIVLDDADIDTAVDLTIKGGLSLTGQACTGTSRVLVTPAVKTRFVSSLVTAVKQLTIGNGMNPDTEIGPLANQNQLDTVMEYIAIGKSEATHVYGGDRLTGHAYDKGYFVLPAIFTDVTQQMRIAREEIFGPVIAVIDVEDYDDAINKANDTEYGLSAALVTNNIKYIQRFPSDIESGTVKVNRTTTGNLVNAPFGGIKMSSTSTFRESGRVGLEFFTQLKTVYIGQ